MSNCRYLKYLGYEVNYVRNFTGIDDKVIAQRLPLSFSKKKKKRLPLSSIFFFLPYIEDGIDLSLTYNSLSFGNIHLPNLYLAISRFSWNYCS